MFRSLILAMILVGCGAPAAPSTPSRENVASPPEESPEEPTAKAVDTSASEHAPPAPEIGRIDPTMTEKLPAVPEFKVPPMIGDAHVVEELLRHGQPLLGKRLKVRGFIVWIYDCASAIKARTPGMSNKQLRRILRNEPERCSRPHLRLASSAGANELERISVVEIPRKIRPDEKRALPADVVANWPKVPKLKVGEEVVISGTWALKSPRGFQDSRGLLVFESVQHLP